MGSLYSDKDSIFNAESAVSFLGCMGLLKFLSLLLFFFFTIRIFCLLS